MKLLTNTKKMNKYILLVTILITSLYSCNNEESLTDATGVFEATEVIVSSESNGKILAFNMNEGDVIKKRVAIGFVDSSDLVFTKRQLLANKKVALASLPNVAAQIEATQQEIDKQEREKERIAKLLAGDVATQKQMDDVEAAIIILKARLRSQKSMLSNSTNSVNAQAAAIDVQIEQVNDQLKKCNIYSPIDGTILVKYAEQGELTARGKPLFKVADVEKMFLKAYVTASQLTEIKLGQTVKVFGEFGESDNRPYDGKITWISSKSEFTPKTIQTQDERANLVYAVKIAVKNDSYLKIGMYGGFKIEN